MNRENLDITEGIDSVVWNAIDKSIENNSKEAFRTLHSFVLEIIFLSISKASLKHFSTYVMFLPHYYSASYEKALHSTSLSLLHKFCSEQASLSLRDITWLGIGSINKKANTVAQQKKVNEFYYRAFIAFGRMFFYALKNKDFRQFRLCVEQFDTISDSNSQQSHRLKYELRQLKRENIDGRNNDRIKELQEQVEVFDKFQTYRRHTLMGVKYWIIFLHQVKKFNSQTTIKYLKYINIPHADSEDLINDVLFFKGGHLLLNYMEWAGWDFKERISGKSYTPPHPPEWLTLGFIADQIRENRLYVNVEELDERQLSNMRFLLDDLRTYTNMFEQNFDRWKDFFKVASVEELRTKYKPLEKLFESVKRRQVSAVDRAIANAALSAERVNQFRQTIGAAWKSQARLHRLFQTNQNTELVEDTAVRLRIVGQRTFFEKAKPMFIDGQYHSSIYGIEQMGGQTGRWEDDEFFNTILKAEHNQTIGTTLVQTLDHILNELNEKEVVPDMIFFQSEYTYSDSALLQSDKFVARNLIADPGELGIFQLGTYDSIPVYTSFSNHLNGKVIVCDFQRAFKMRYRTDPSWYEQQLKVDVTQVTDEIATQKLAENPTKWKRQDDGTELSDADALILIKTSVILDIWTVLQFIVTDKDAYYVGYLLGERQGIRS